MKMRKIMRVTVFLGIMGLVLSVSPLGRAATPIAYWLFDEGTAGNAASGAGSVLDSYDSHDGTPLDSPVYRSDTPFSYTGNLSMDFDPSSSRVEVPESGFDLTSALTIAAWIKQTDSDGITARILTKGYNSSYSLMYFEDERTLKFEGEIGGVDVSYFSTGSIPMDEWHHVAMTFEADEYVKFYIDGQWDSSHAVSGSLGTDNNAVDIGGRYGYSFNGLIDEVVVYGATLTQPEVDALYDNSLNNPIPEPTSLLLFGSGVMGLLYSIRRKKRV